MQQKLVSLPFWYARGIVDTQTLTGYAKGVERQIQSAGLGVNVLSIASLGGSNWRITLETTPATVDTVPAQVGDLIQLYDVNAAWNDPLTFLITAKNNAARTFDVTHPGGVAVAANAPGTARVFAAVPQYNTISSYNRAVLFNAIELPKGNKVRVKDPYVSVQAALNVEVTDTQLDFLHIIIVPCVKNPFRALYEGLNVAVNVYSDRATGALSYSILPGTPSEYEKIELVPADVILENEHWPKGNNLLLETAQSDLAEYLKVNLEKFAESLGVAYAGGRPLVIPITPQTSHQIFHTHEMPRGADYLLCFASLGNENTSNTPQRVKGRINFAVEVE